MAELKIDLIVDNKGSIQIQKFGIDAAKSFYQAVGPARELTSAVNSSSSSFSSFGKIAKSSLAIFSTYEVLQFAKSIGETVVQLDSLQRSFAGITGSQQQAVVEMEYLRQVSDKTGQNFYNLAGGYQQLTASTKGTNLEGKKTRDVFLAVSEAAAVLGLSQDQVDLSIRALGQMASKGQVQMEELKSQLGDHIPGAVQIAARALGVTTKELYDMSKRGDLLAEDVLPAIAAELHKMYGQAAQTAALESGQAAVNKLSEAWKDFKANIANSQMVIDTIWGIAGALQAVSKFSASKINIDVGIGVGGEGVKSLEYMTEREMQLKRVSFLQRDIAASEQEILRIQGNASRQGASGQQSKAIADLTEKIAASKKELTSLNKVVNNQSPFVTGEAAGKVNVAADAFGYLGFKMQGVREMSKSEREEYVKSHNEMLKYVETDEQAAKKRFDAAYAGARSEKERAEVTKKYEEELEEIKKRKGKAGESAAKKAAKEAEKEAAAYQATIERLLPLERAQREYSEDLAALDKMDPTHSTERYKTALANLNQELQDAVENSQKYAKAQEDAKMSAFESELNQKSTAIEISIAQGNLTDKSALPFQIDILQQKLKAYQDRLANMPKKTSEDISAWNSQAEAIQQTTLELARYQQQMRLLDTNESFKQGMIDWRESGPQEMADFYRTALPNALDSSADATSKLFRDLAQGNMTAGEAWRAFGQTVSDVIFDILQEMIKLEIKMAMINSMGASGGIGGFFSGLLGFGSSSSSWASSGTAFSDASQIASWMSFANGGIMSSAGPLPLRSYASGGIANSPQLALFGEGRMNEAYVPLPDGRSIPVTVSGGGSSDDETRGLLRDLITAVQAGGSTRIINAFDGDTMANAMNSSAGERVILNAIKRNPSAIRSMLR